MIKEMVKHRFPGLKYLFHLNRDGLIILDVESVQKTAICPYCGYPSSRVHSYHIRKFHDLPYEGNELLVRLHNKKFFCENKNCSHTTFVEQFDFISPAEKKTDRLIDEILSAYNDSSSRETAFSLKETGINVCKATVCNLKNKYS
ncbi:MAG: transposase family protein [Bacilli bacterium]|nr:transposase family protein [Bacilli bacterium]